MNAKKERQLNELREGYKNAQELIRFMDAKVGIVVGFSGMIFVHCMDKYYASFLRRVLTISQKGGAKLCP